MKQNITIEQWNELPEKSKETLVSWTTGKNYDDLLYIGEMIEFLLEKNPTLFSEIQFYGNMPDGKTWRFKQVSWEKSYIDIYSEKGLCDVLWEAVKKSL